MTREQTIEALRPYFRVSELVCQHTYARFGEQSWQFLDTDLLRVLLYLRRDLFGKPIVCNGGTARQRGLRCNRCDLVKSKTQVYLSAHLLGKGLDLTIK